MAVRLFAALVQKDGSAERGLLGGDGCVLGQ